MTKSYENTTAHAFGVDIGGSGIKGAPVDLAAESDGFLPKPWILPQ